MLLQASSYKLLPGVKPNSCLLKRRYPYPKVVSPCDNINANLAATTKRVLKSLTDLGYPMVYAKKATGVHATICNTVSTPNYGSYNPITKQITIQDSLLILPRTLYNVVLHEMLHSLGLDHSDEQGIMAYSVRQDVFNFPLEDTRRLWLSQDDLDGLALL